MILRSGRDLWHGQALVLRPIQAGLRPVAGSCSSGTVRTRVTGVTQP